MQPAEYETLAALENRYWWFIGKQRLVKAMIQQYSPVYSEKGCILDLGCGAGANLTQLQALTSLAVLMVGFDRSAMALKFAKRAHNHSLGQADILRLPVADQVANIITLLDVLYHQWVRDDELALAESYRVLKPGGLLILTAPAFDFLTGPHDVANLTARRYRLSQMMAKLTRTGFEIKKQSYVYAALFPFAFLWRWGQRIWGDERSSPISDLRPLPFWLNRLLLTLFLLELAWLKKRSLFWGTSILFVARKPDAIRP